MKHLGIEIPVKNMPALDPEFIPIGLFNRAFLCGTQKPVSFAVERAGGQMATVHTFIHGTEEMSSADLYYADRLGKRILWMQGGFKVYVSGDESIYHHLKAAYSPNGSRAFDADFMSSVFEKPFEVVLCGEVPRSQDRGFPGPPQEDRRPCSGPAG